MPREGTREVDPATTSVPCTDKLIASSDNDFSLVSRVHSELEMSSPNRVTIARLLRPHRLRLVWAVLAAIGVGIAGLAEPWPLKLVLDQVLRGKEGSGWLYHFTTSQFGDDKLAILKFAAVAALLIAVVDALCSYCEKF